MWTSRLALPGTLAVRVLRRHVKGLHVHIQKLPHTPTFTLDAMDLDWDAILDSGPTGFNPVPAVDGIDWDAILDSEPAPVAAAPVHMNVHAQFEAVRPEKQSAALVIDEPVPRLTFSNADPTKRGPKMLANPSRDTMLRRKRRELQADAQWIVDGYHANPKSEPHQLAFLEVLRTKRGQQIAGRVGELLQTNTDAALVTAHMADLLGGLGSGGNSFLRAPIVARLTGGVSKKYIVEELKVDAAFAASARHSERSRVKPSVLESNHSLVKTVQRQADDAMWPEYKGLFFSHTSQISGSNTDTVVMPQSFTSFNRVCLSH
jgi:hypothetical protein